VILASISPPFLRFQNLANILDQQAGIIIVAAPARSSSSPAASTCSIGAVYGSRRDRGASCGLVRAGRSGSSRHRRRAGGRPRNGVIVTGSGSTR
jgi:hypothetical protein